MTSTVTRTFHVEVPQMGPFIHGVNLCCDVVMQETYDGDMYRVALGSPDNAVTVTGERPLSDDEVLAVAEKAMGSAGRIVNRCDGQADLDTIRMWCETAADERMDEVPLHEEAEGENLPHGE